MIATARREVKPRTATTKSPRVIFDATRHRNRFSPAFAAGLVESTRWTGQHAFSPFTADDVDFASECFRHASEAEVDAEEQAYHEMLDAMAFEDACVSRLSRGHCL